MTVSKDFKVKHGLQVADGATFGGPIVAAAATDSNHVVTKGYADSIAGRMPSSETPPSDPVQGQMWLDTVTNRMRVYIGSTWVTQALFDDTLNIVQHIHDTSIDGTGLIITTFKDGATINSPEALSIDGGTPSEAGGVGLVLDGGTASDFPIV